MPVGMFSKRSDVGVPPSPRIAEDMRTTRNRTGILCAAGFRRRVPHRGSRSLRTAEPGFRRIVRRPFNVPWPGPVDRHVLLGRCPFKNLPARRRHRCDHVACPRVSDHDGTVPRRPSPAQRDEQTDSRVETVLVVLRRRGKPRRFAGPPRQRREAQRTRVAPDGRCDQSPIRQREVLVRRVVARRAITLHDLGFQRGQSERGVNFHQMQSVRRRTGGRRILPGPDPVEKSPDGNIRTEHSALSAKSGLNAAAQFGDQRRRNAFDRTHAGLVGHQRRLIDGDEHVLAFVSQPFDDPGGVFEANGFGNRQSEETILLERRPRNAAGIPVGPGRVESDECFAHCSHPQVSSGRVPRQPVARASSATFGVTVRARSVNRTATGAAGASGLPSRAAPRSPGPDRSRARCRRRAFRGPRRSPRGGRTSRRGTRPARRSSRASAPAG